MNQPINNIRLSVIVPVFNRPDEVFELLESLKKQTDSDFEIILVEDGSVKKCLEEIQKFQTSLTINYFYKENSGPGLSRNFGAEKASGNYFIFLDSDCIVPEQYISIVKKNLNEKYTDAYGGPDSAHVKFTNFQKAVNYVMTSFLTTGGIRGGGEKMDKFYPRSFNMGYSKEVFIKTGGFSSMRFGEDIDMSIRILKNGFTTGLYKDAFVYHKRRSNYRQFFKQVYNSGIARIHLYKKYPESLKLVHFFPAVFLIGSILLIILSVFVSPFFISPLILFISSIFFDALIKTKSPVISTLSVIVCIIQQTGYGSGFMLAFWKRIIQNQGEFTAYRNNFYE
jgi:glycosyltransferase involved in cell wall biosynthesis